MPAMSRKLHVGPSIKLLDKRIRKLSVRDLLKELKELAAPYGSDKEAEELAEYYLTEIAASQRRMRKLSAEIDRVGEKTQAILDKLPK